MTLTAWRNKTKRQLGSSSTLMADTTALMADTTALMGGSASPTVWSFSNKHS